MKIIITKNGNNVSSGKVCRALDNPDQDLIQITYGNTVPLTLNAYVTIGYACSIFVLRFVLNTHEVHMVGN